MTQEEINEATNISCGQPSYHFQEVEYYFEKFLENGCVHIPRAISVMEITLMELIQLEWRATRLGYKIPGRDIHITRRLECAFSLWEESLARHPKLLRRRTPPHTPRLPKI